MCSCSVNKNYFWQYSKYELIKKSNLHFIKLTLNNKQALFLIDSGSSKSFIDINQYEYYKFLYIDKPIEKYIGIGGPQNIFAIFNYNIDEMFIPMLGIDLDEINPYFISNDINISGIIGADYLNSRSAIINYDNNNLYLK